MPARPPPVHAERMSAADATWLRLDAPENPSVVTAVVWLAGPLAHDRLRALLGERLVATHPRFRSVVRARGVPLLPPVWVPDPAFDIDRHLSSVHLEDRAPGGGDRGLERVVSTLLGRRLDPAAAPPWQLVLVDGYRPAPADRPRSVLVGRLHHTLADGAALVRLLLELTDTEPRDRTAPAPPARARRPGWAGAAAAAARLVPVVPLTAVRLLLLTPEPRTPLRGRPGVRKDVAWGEPRSLDDVTSAATAHGVTVNDVLLAAVAGGFARYLRHRQTRRLPASLRVIVPVDLGAADPRLGNRFGVLPLRLPVSEPDPVRRMRRIARRTRAAKRSLVPAATFVLIGALGVVPAALRRLLVRLLGTRATAIVTNVPGPRQPLTLAGVPVDAVAFWVPQAAAVGVGISLFSYAGTVRIGVAVDAGLVPDVHVLADALDDALAELLVDRHARDTPPGRNSPGGSGV